tara:strand:- start:1130 stop:2191 length:1062 start_codon:yes stop_codon:yes gene_type:complete
MATNTTTSLSNQYQNYFSKKLLSYAVQALVLDQFAEKAPLPAKAGHKAISMFRFDAPSVSAIETLTEGTTTSGTRSLTLSKIEKSLIQRGQVIKMTDVLTATDLFNSLQQSIKVNGQDAALDMDTQTRNTLVGSNVAGTAKENGDGSALDNSDTLTEMYADGGTDYSTFDAVTSADTILSASSILDAVTKLKVNRAQPAKGGMYVAATSAQVLSDIQKVSEWLNAAQYSNVEELYKGEVGSLYGAKFILHTNGWSSVYSSADDDRFAYSVGGTGTRAAGANIRATLFLGQQAYGVPELTSSSPFSPKVIITDSADKTDPLNQLITAGFKTHWTTLRLNPAYYVVMRSKTDSTA